MMTKEKLYVLRELRDSILADRKALRKLENMERRSSNAKTKGLLQSLYRGEIPDDYAERAAGLRNRIYKKQRRYLTEEATLEKEFASVSDQYVRVTMSLYFADVMTKRNTARRIGKGSGHIVEERLKKHLRNSLGTETESPEKTLLRELNEFRLVELQMERLVEKLERPNKYPDFFLPFEEAVEIPVMEIWQEELEALSKRNLRVIAYIESIPVQWERNILQTRFIEGKTARETARDYGQTARNISSIVHSCLRRYPEGYLSSRQIAELWGTHIETVLKYCREGKLPGAVKRCGYGFSRKEDNRRIWMIPADTPKPTPIRGSPSHKRQFQCPEGYLSCSELADLWGVSTGVVAKYCRQGKLPGAVRWDGDGQRWMIPADVPKPEPDKRPKDYLSCREVADLWGMHLLTIQKYCRRGRIPGAVRWKGREWMIPSNAPKPTGKGADFS